MSPSRYRVLFLISVPLQRMIADPPLDKCHERSMLRRSNGTHFSNDFLPQKKHRARKPRTGCIPISNGDCVTTIQIPRGRIAHLPLGLI